MPHLDTWSLCFLYFGCCLATGPSNLPGPNLLSLISLNYKCDFYYFVTVEGRVLKVPLSMDVLFAHISDDCVQYFAPEVKVHVVYVWLHVFIRGDRFYCVPLNGGASSSVIHPQAKTIKKQHAPHSSPSPSLFSSHKRSSWSEVSRCCLCLCGPLCIYACSAAGWMTWGRLYNSWEPWNSATELQRPFRGFWKTLCIYHVFHRLLYLQHCWCKSAFINSELQHIDGKPLVLQAWDDHHLIYIKTLYTCSFSVK